MLERIAGKRPALVLLALILLLSPALAVPDPPSGLAAEIVGYSSVRISWEHRGGSGVTFNIYRGSSIEDASLLATVSEKFFVDSSRTGKEMHLYFVTAVDSSGESRALQTILVKPLEPTEKPFVISVVSPESRTFEFGEEVEFVVSIESPFLNELENLKAVLVNEDFGVQKQMAFNPLENTFSVRERLPEAEAEIEEGFSTVYTIQVSASLAGESFSESESYVLTMIPMTIYTFIDPWEAAVSFFTQFGPFFFWLAVAGTIVFVGWKWALKRQTQMDAIRLELVEVLKERAIWKYDMLKRRISAQQYAEKERELQGKQNALEMKLGRHKKGISVSLNPFAGFTRAQIEEVGRLVKTMSPQKREMNKDQMRAWLVGRGRSEKVAKKAAELIYQK